MSRGGVGTSTPGHAKIGLVDCRRPSPITRGSTFALLHLLHELLSVAPLTLRTMSCSVSAAPLADLSRHCLAAPAHLVSSSAHAHRTASLAPAQEALDLDFQHFLGKGKARAQDTAVPREQPCWIHQGTTRSLLDPMEDDEESEPSRWSSDAWPVAVIANGSGTSPRVSLPSSDEAASISNSRSSTPASYLVRSSSTGLAKRSQTPPHALTHSAALNAAWDFERLFSADSSGGRRSRSVVEGETSLESVATHDTHGGVHRRARSSSRLREEVRPLYCHSPTCRQNDPDSSECQEDCVEPGVEMRVSTKQEAQALVGRKMKERLDLIQFHLSWKSP